MEEKKADAPDKENADAKGKGKGKKKGEKLEDELSPEDEELKTQMELLVTRAQDKELEIRKAALQAMVKEIRTATSSMTSVPKPLKFLGPHYVTLKESYEGASADETKVMLADVLSMLAMTNAEPGVRESLSFKLKGTPSELATWGHEYVRHLSGEIAEEYNERLSDETGAKGKAADLMPLIVDHMVPFFIEHNAEAEAIDLLSEVGTIDSQRGMSLVALAAPLPATAARAPAWWLPRRSLPLVRAAEGGRGHVTLWRGRRQREGWPRPPPSPPSPPSPRPPPSPPSPPPNPHARRSAAPLSFGQARAARRQDQLRAHRHVPEPGGPVRARARGRAGARRRRRRAAQDRQARGGDAAGGARCGLTLLSQPLRPLAPRPPPPPRCPPLPPRGSRSPSPPPFHPLILRR